MHFSSIDVFITIGFFVQQIHTSSIATVPLDASCSRASLLEVTDRYVAAQSTGLVDYLKALANIENITYTENMNATAIRSGVLVRPLKIDHSRSTHDPAACATYTELIVTEPKHPYVIGTQIRLTNGNITRIDSIVTETGDWLFSPKHTLHYALPESWGEIPVDKRDTRATIQAAADAYLDLFKNKSTIVPWGYPCARLEGGLYTAKGFQNDSCNVGVPSGLEMKNRKYVIDETLGTVDVMLSFGNSSLPDSHEFRVESGKLRYVHTITHCFTPNCGFSPSAELSQDPGY